MKRPLFALAIAALLGTAGCEAEPETEIRLVCTKLCGCLTGIGAIQDECIVDCIDDIGPFDPPPGCVACFQSLTCDEIRFDDDQCNDACSTAPVAPQETP